MRYGAVPLAVIAATGVTLGACGGGDKKTSGNTAATTPAQASAQAAQARTTITDLGTAGRAGDVKKICDELFSKRLASVVAANDPSKSCEAAAKRSLGAPNEQIKIDVLTVDGPKAQATVTEQNGSRSILRLVQEGGKWRVDGILPLKKHS